MIKRLYIKINYLEKILNIEISTSDYNRSS